MVEWKTLGDIMTIVRGASPRPIKNFITDSEEGINWIKIGDVSPDAKYITKANERITKEGAEKSRFLHEGDFILSNSMSFGRPYILKIDGCIHDGWIAMSDFEKHVSPGYLYEILNSNGVQDYWKMKANNGGAMTNLNSDIVRSTIIPIPSISEQTRIVGILDTFTSAIDNLKEQIALRRKQYEYYRDQLLDLEGKEGVERLTLKDVCEVINGRAYSQPELLSEGKYRVLRVGNFFSNDSWYYSDLELENKYYCEKGDLLYAWSASFGPHIWEEEKVIYHYHIWKMDCGKRLHRKYMYYWLQSDDMKKQAFSNLHGATMAHLTKALMESLQVPIPTILIQQRIVSILDTFEASIQNLEAQLKQREKQYEYYRNKLLTF